MAEAFGLLRTSRSRVAFFTGLAVLLGGGLWLWWWSARGSTIHSLERLVRRRFPRVPQISTEELAMWLAGTKEKPVLLDVREYEEYLVSHLPEARHVSPDTRAARLRDWLPRKTPIVTYCAIGYRSSAFANRLIQAGYTNVQNLEGSIFRWANEDRPLQHDGKPTDKVHPYSNYWARLVKPERRAALPIRE